LHDAPEKGAPVEEPKKTGSIEYSPVKYSGLSSRRRGSESRPEHYSHSFIYHLQKLIYKLLLSNTLHSSRRM